MTYHFTTVRSNAEKQSGNEPENGNRVLHTCYIAPVIVLSWLVFTHGRICTKMFNLYALNIMLHSRRPETYLSGTGHKTRTTTTTVFVHNSIQVRKRNAWRYFVFSHENSLLFHIIFPGDDTVYVRYFSNTTTRLVWRNGPHTTKDDDPI